MVALKLPMFGGMVPAVDDRLLPDTAAAHAENVFLYSGAANGIPQPKLLHTPQAGTARVFRIPASYDNAAYLYDSVWMEFADPDTDVIRAPVFNDTYDRYYWASGGLAPRYNTRARIANGDPEYLLGINPPGTAPTCTVTGGAGSDVTRSYVYTWVSTFGEESAPSPPLVKTGKVDGSWDLTMTAAAADDLDGTDRLLTLVRIYRTIVGISGIATYFLVAEQAIADTTYSDVLLDDVVALSSQLESVGWTPPPSDLKGFVTMPNGIVASWRSNELWFSEAYRPHAWPVAYVLTVEYPIVGLGVTGQTLVACTQSSPITASGVSPAFITTSKLPATEPCTSRGSIVSAPEGVYYASTNGLVLVAPGRAENVTKDLITQDKWQLLTRSSKLRAGRFSNAYYAFGSVQAGVFDDPGFDTDAFTQEDFSGARTGVLVDLHNQRVALNVLSSEDPVSLVMNDTWSGELFLVRDGEVQWIDLSDSTVPIEPFIWRSKIFQMPVKENLGAMKVYFEVPDPAPVDYGEIDVLADGTVVGTYQLATSGAMHRLPSGFKADFWQFEVRASVKILSIHVAESPRGLKNV